MSARIDHVAEAQNHIEAVHEWQSYVGSTDESNIANALIAQAEATLALVEQQRIANHIAYVALLEAQYAEAATRPGEFQWTTRAASEDRHGRALDRIREGLGL